MASGRRLATATVEARQSACVRAWAKCWPSDPRSDGTVEAAVGDGIVCAAQPGVSCGACQKAQRRVPKASRHSGVIHSGIYYESGSLKAQLCVEGNELIYDYAENNNIDYLKCGKLIVGHDDSDLQKLRELKEKGTSNGVKDLRIISPEYFKLP